MYRSQNGPDYWVKNKYHRDTDPGTLKSNQIAEVREITTEFP